MILLLGMCQIMRFEDFSLWLGVRDGEFCSISKPNMTLIMNSPLSAVNAMADHNAGKSGFCRVIHHSVTQQRQFIRVCPYFAGVFSRTSLDVKKK